MKVLMNRQYARRDEEWVPVSDWGREQKRRNEEYLRDLAMEKREAKRQAKPKQKRVRPRVAARRDYGTCPNCSRPLGASNKSGVCSKCYSKHRAVAKGPRPLCPECGKPMLRTNKLGICRKCFRAPMPQNKCAKCDNLLHPTNKTGLCKKHGAVARQKAYLERKRAA